MPRKLRNTPPLSQPWPPRESFELLKSADLLTAEVLWNPLALMGSSMSFSEPDSSAVLRTQIEQKMNQQSDVLPLTATEGQMQMGSALENLPDETVREICEFLRKETPLDAYYFGKRAPNQTDIRAMLSTCTRLRELKLAETGLWPFNRVYSKIYCTEEAFRAEVDGAFAAMGFGFDEDGNPQKHSQS